MTQDIWIQPAKGFTEESAGRSEAQILAKEARIRFKFPELYREHMKLQNGGLIRNGALVHDGIVYELLINGSTIDPILDGQGYVTLKDVLSESMEDEELETSSIYKYFDLTRLPILSCMDGHTMLCFDYGYNVESIYESPQIVYFELEGAENGFEEKLRVKTYDDLINNLVYYGYGSTSFQIGVKSSEPIETLAENFSKIYGTQLELREDDGYGWYDFEKWYWGSLKFSPNLALFITIIPNQFLSKNYVFQNNKDCAYIIQVEVRIGVDSFQDNSDFIKSIIEEKLEPFLALLEWDFLLTPYHQENHEELQRIKNALAVDETQ